MTDLTAQAPEQRAIGRLPRRSAWLIMLAFFLSGVAALIYQIVWAKQLSLVFGVTVYATSAVVTAFMAGLALGSLYFGRLADRLRSPLALFAVLEFGIGAFGLVFPVILRVLEPIYVYLYGHLGESHYVMSLVRFALSFAVLLVPTCLMGGTLPVLARAYVSRTERVGREVAGLYSANNFGAFLGCFLAGYAFLELLGVSGTTRLAAGLNVVAAVIAIALVRMGGRARGPAAEPEPEPEAPPRRLPAPVKVALWVFAIEGFTSLAYQMAWLRMLIFFVQTNVYAITAIVATFLVGLSLGAFLVRPFVDRTRNPYRMLGIIEMGIGLAALATILLLPWMFGFYGQFSESLLRWGWAGTTAARFTICFIVILVPTCFMGATLPVVSRIYVHQMGRLGSKMGILGCLDTVGSIFGSFAGAFIMIPLLGIQRTIIATALINLALAAWVFAADPVTRRRMAARAGLVLALLALVLAPLMLAARPLPLISYSPSPALFVGSRIVDYQEDAESTVTVVDQFGQFYALFVNHAAVAQTTRIDRPSHEMIAHTPLLLHPNPQRVLLIGFGIGFTSWACTAHECEVDVVELSPGVRRANRWLKDFNHDILTDPRVHIRIDDGRNYVLGTQQKYDMIQAGIIHPALNSGNSSFYTPEFYRDCKRILRPGGIVCQWLPLHAIPAEDFKMLIRSFLAEFPHVSVWYKHTGEFCTLVGSMEPLHIDFQEVERRVNVPRLRSHLARCGVVDAYDWLDSFCAADRDVRQAVGDGPLHTDDRPYIEFHCNRPVPVAAHPRNIRLMAAMRRRVWPYLTNVPAERADRARAELERWFEGTQSLLEAQRIAEEVDHLDPTELDYERGVRQMLAAFNRTLTLNPADRNADFLRRTAVAIHLLRLARVDLAAGRMSLTLERLREAASMAPGTYASGFAEWLYRDLRTGRP